MLTSLPFRIVYIVLFMDIFADYSFNIVIKIVSPFISLLILLQIFNNSKKFNKGNIDVYEYVRTIIMDNS
jgi:hypothetical protein